MNRQYTRDYTPKFLDHDKKLENQYERLSAVAMRHIELAETVEKQRQKIERLTELIKIMWVSTGAVLPWDLEAFQRDEVLVYTEKKKKQQI